MNRTITSAVQRLKSLLVTTRWRHYQHSSNEAASETEKQERWNNLLLQNNTDTLQHTNGISDAEQNLHAMGFSVWHTPPRWGLKPTGVEKLPPEQIDALFRQLDKLNNLTTYLDRLEQESARLGQHIYECWCLLAYIAEQLSTSDADKAWQQQLDKIRQHILDSLKGGRKTITL